MIPDAVQYGRRPSALITWSDADGDAQDLNGATLTGTIRDAYGNSRAITGSLTLTDAENGVFRWDYSEADVAQAGRLFVKFSAAFGSGQTPANTERTKWTVKE